MKLRQIPIWLISIGMGLTSARAEDPTLPTFRSFAGAFLAGHTHNFYVESELQLPILREDPVGLYYRHRETTPFLDLKDPQAEVLFEREELRMDFTTSEHLRLIAIGGYHRTPLLDKSGTASAYVLGGGIGSPLRSNGDRLHWQALAGAYLEAENLPADWWTDLSVSWKIIEFARGRYLGSDYRASIALVAGIEAAFDDDRFDSMYRLGPELQFLTATGNRANFHLGWYRNDGNRFFGSDETALLLGLDVTASLDKDYVFDAREKRQSGWFPMIWGGYDVGANGNTIIQRFDMNVEAVDFRISEQQFTTFVWYETRQEHRAGGFDNVAYSVSLGLQTFIGLASPLSHDDPLVAGLDFVHRSDHAINPDPSRVPSDAFMDHNSINLLARLRLQTPGWDLPYRDPGIYERKTSWINSVDWRITAANSRKSSTRRRGAFAGQLGANWDIATIEGYVVYARGLGSIGNEMPDWQGEVGVRRPAGKMFVRCEDYGMGDALSRGEIFVVGIGVNL